MDKTTISEVIRLHQYFKDSKYSSIINEAINLCYEEKYEDAKIQLTKLPTSKELLIELIEKLKGKSVYTGLNKVVEGKTDNQIENLKVISSLKTHCIIEAKDRPEYFLLLEELEETYKSLKEGILNV